MKTSFLILVSHFVLLTGALSASDAQEIYYTLFGNGSTEPSLATGGDIDGDGFSEIIVGVETLSSAGSILIYSGKDGLLQQQINGVANADRFGGDVSFVGDLNNDGCDDFAVGAWLSETNGGDSGSVTVFSGKDSSILFVGGGESPGDRLGIAIDGGGDVNGDGIPETLAGAPRDDNSGSDSGSVIVFSRTGMPLLVVNGTSANDRFGTSVSFIGDVNGDGFDDFLAGSSAGYVRLVSGFDGVEILTVSAPSVVNYGSAVAGLEDISGDGIPDFVVGAYDASFNGTSSGRVYAYSGADGALLWTIDGNPTSRLGYSLDAAGDLNLDGVPDVLAGAIEDETGGNDAGMVLLISGVDGSDIASFTGTAIDEKMGYAVAGQSYIGQTCRPVDFVVAGDGRNDVVYAFAYDYSLCASAVEISNLSGGIVSYQMNFESGASGDTYQILISQAGSGPITLGSIEVPVTFDSLVYDTFLGNYPPGVFDFIGTLDSEGRALGHLVLAPNSLPGVVGRTVYLGAVCRPIGGPWRYASNGATLTFLP